MKLKGKRKSINFNKNIKLNFFSDNKNNNEQKIEYNNSSIAINKEEVNENNKEKQKFNQKNKKYNTSQIDEYNKKMTI